MPGANCATVWIWDEATDHLSSPVQHGWTRVQTPRGRYEYQFQGRTPAVRNAQYLDAGDYLFLVLDADGWLYRIPVRMASGAEEAVKKAGADPLLLAEEQVRRGLAQFTPRQNAPYGELDRFFSVGIEVAREFLAALGKSS